MGATSRYLARQTICSTTISWSPAETRLQGAHSSHSVAPCTNTAPLSVAIQSTLLNRSPVLDASARAMGAWSPASTDRPRRLSLASFGQVLDVLATHTDTSGGPSQTEGKQRAAIPPPPPPGRPPKPLMPQSK